MAKEQTIADLLREEAQEAEEDLFDEINTQPLGDRTGKFDKGWWLGLFLALFCGVSTGLEFNSFAVGLLTAVIVSILYDIRDAIYSVNLDEN